MKEFLYGEDSQIHELLAPLFIAGEPIHLEGFHWSAPLKIFFTDTNQAVGIACGLENPTGSRYVGAQPRIPPFQAKGKSWLESPMGPNPLGDSPFLVLDACASQAY